VGQPPQSRRLLGHFADRLGLALGVHREDALVVLVREPEAILVPARAFGKREVVEEDGGGAAHGSDPASVGLMSSSVRAADSGNRGITTIAAARAPMPVSAIDRPRLPSGSESTPATMSPATDPLTPRIASNAFDVPRTSVAKSSASRVPSAMPP